MTVFHPGPARDLILTFPLRESLAQAEHAAAGTAFDMRHHGSLDQPALMLAVSRGISLASNALDPNDYGPVQAVGWATPSSVEAAQAQQDRLRASHFGGDSQLHLIALDPGDDDGDNLTIIMRKGLAAGHRWLAIVRTPDAFRIVTAGVAVPDLPRFGGPPTAITEELLDRLRFIAAGTDSHRLQRTLVSPQTAAAILAVHDSADALQRQHLLGLPMALLSDLAFRVVGSSR